MFDAFLPSGASHSRRTSERKTIVEVEARIFRRTNRASCTVNWDGAIARMLVRDRRKGWPSGDRGGPAKTRRGSGGKQTGTASVGNCGVRLASELVAAGRIRGLPGLVKFRFSATKAGRALRMGPARHIRSRLDRDL